MHFLPHCRNPLKGIHLAALWNHQTTKEKEKYCIVNTQLIRKKVHFNALKRSCLCVEIGGFSSSLLISAFHGPLAVNAIMIIGSKK